jgi:hypothetical protein
MTDVTGITVLLKGFGQRAGRAASLVVRSVRCFSVVLTIGPTVANNNERGEDP